MCGNTLHKKQYTYTQKVSNGTPVLTISVFFHTLPYTLFYTTLYMYIYIEREMYSFVGWRICYSICYCTRYFICDVI